MFFTVNKYALLPHLKALNGVIESRDSILSHILVETSSGQVRLTAVETGLQVTCKIPVETSVIDQQDKTTIPARKWYDIVRSLPEDSHIEVSKYSVEDKVVKLKSGKSRFTLACLPPEEYPNYPAIDPQITFSLSQSQFKEMLSQTSFSSGVSDIRHYLNGVCLDFKDGKLSAVATDGHRLAMLTEPLELPGKEPVQVIIPRKTVIELQKMLGDTGDLTLTLGTTQIKIEVSDQLTVVSKLVDGRFPNYEAVLPSNILKEVTIQCHAFKQALSQASILCGDKSKSIRLSFTENLLQVSAKNPNQEESEIECEVEYTGEPFDIGFNATYLLDVLSVMPSEKVRAQFTDVSSSVLLIPEGISNMKYVVMPMRL